MTHHNTANFNSINLLFKTLASAAVPKTGRQMELLYAECQHASIECVDITTFGLSPFTFSSLLYLLTLTDSFCEAQ